MKRVCLYHGSDLDGHCSGAIYAYAHESLEFHLHPIDYGEPVPWSLLKDAQVTMMDFSLQPWSEFERLLHEAESVTWIDHHKSAIEEHDKHYSELSEKITGNFKTRLSVGSAACELAWNFYFPGTGGSSMPWAVRLLGRYDVWDHQDPDVLPFQYGMRLLDLAPDAGRDRETWPTFFGDCDGRVGHSEALVRSTIEDGRKILAYQEKQDAELAQRAWYPLEFAGRRWQAVNRLGKGSSFFKAIWNPVHFDGMLSYGWDGNQWIVGLYSDRDDVDCGAIAKEQGGGGHKGAAGFQCKVLPEAFIRAQETRHGQSLRHGPKRHAPG